MFNPSLSLRPPTCHGYSLASVVVPPTILATLLAWPHLQLARGGAGRGGGGGRCGAGGEEAPVGEAGQTHLNTAYTTTTATTTTAEMEACIMDVIITAWCLIN